MLLKQTSVIGLTLLLYGSIAYSSPVRKADKIDSTRVALVEPNTTSPLTTADIPQLTQNEKRLASEPIHDLLEIQHSPFRQLMEANHNGYVKPYINKYASRNYASHLSEMKGLASYYFPIFEKIFREVGIPSDIKYLAVIESSLNPHAVSRVGATGPWQFMYATARGYGLQINSYVDERKDPIEATYAAANYLKKAYETYGDWFVAIASYNCGPGNVNRAIQRSGKTNPTFWDIRPYLPNETKNYVPAFIAMSHILGNAELYPIEADYSDLPEEIDVVLIDKKMSLASIAKVMNMQANDLYKLNPSYRKKVINGTKINPSRVIVPKIPKSEYAKVYNFLQGTRMGSAILTAKNTNESDKPDLIAEAKSKETGKSAKQNYYIAYKVKKGDTLDAITKQFK